MSSRFQITARRTSLTISCTARSNLFPAAAAMTRCKRPSDSSYAAQVFERRARAAVSRISSIVAGDPASRRLNDVAEFVRNVAAGDLAAASTLRSGLGELRDLSFRSFSGGYQTMLFVAAAFTLAVAMLCWILVSPDDTSVVRPTPESE